MTPRQHLLPTNLKPSPHPLNNKWHGHHISDKKQPHHTRLLVQNVRGISLHGSTGIDILAHDQLSLHVDIQAISEHCLDTTKYSVTQSLKETLYREIQGPSVCQINSSEEPAIHTYKPGGTGILALRDIVGRLEPSGRGGDPMGRWSYLHLRRKNLPPVTFISAYQVCPRPTNPIGNTAYHQQTRALNMHGRTGTQPRKAFIDDLTAQIQHFKTQGHDIILGGDFNESIQDRNAGLLRLALTTNLIDPFTYHFPHHEDFGTHTTGSRRIDYILISPRLIHSVKAIGYGPFNYVTNSDHRPIIMDLDTKKLFKDTIDLMPPITFRGVRANDKQSTTIFIETMHNELQQHGAFAQQQNLDNNTANPSTVETLDTIIGTVGDYAEKKCKRRRPEFYSRKIVQLRMKASILRGHLASLRTGQNRTIAIQARMERSGVTVDLPPTIPQTKQSLQNTETALREARKQNAELRHAELTTRIDEAVAAGKRNKAKILRAIYKAETSKKLYKIIDSLRRKTSTTPHIDRIEIPTSWPAPHSPYNGQTTLEDPKECTDWREVTTPTEIEYYLLLRNRLHFGQAYGTPFTTSPLTDEFDWAATSKEAEEVLAGTYETTNDIPQCKALLTACQAASDLDMIPAELSRDDFRGKIKRWREGTTTSPSGRHLGRYKALFSPGKYHPIKDERNYKLFAQKQEDIISLILAIINNCIRNNHVLEQWKTIVNVMIFKDPGNYKIHRLRIIHLYEADFNLLLAVKWRQLLRAADENGTINPGQYGGRPGCEAQSLPLLEELKYDLSYMTRRSLFNFDNDAASCYDRIIIALASLVNRKYGLHREIVLIHASTLEQAKFHLKTAAGTSEAHYSHSIQFPIYGSGQGSGNSPCIWLFISSTLFDIHATQAHGARFTTPDGSQSVRITMVGFVDDSTGTCNDFRPQQQDPLPTLTKKMEHDAQIWNDLLHCSGGKLELKKCSFHVLHFSFRPDGTPKPTLDRYENTIQVTDQTTNECITIPAKRATETHKTLGHYKAPAAKPTAPLKTIQHKAKHLTTLISMSPISRYGAHLAYHTIYIPSVKYPLPQSFIPKADLDKAQRTTMGQIIAKCGFNRNTPRPLLFATRENAGGGFLPWYMLQGEGQILQFLKHWRTNTMISDTLRITMTWAQWQAGVAAPILEDTTTKIPYLECRWIRSLRDFLSQTHTKIILDQNNIIRPERQHDIVIMDYARACGLFDAPALKIINYCRLYLHIATVSELFDADARHINAHVFNCEREPWFNPDTYITLQQRPSAHQIKYKWQRLCREWAQHSGEIAASIHLGEWTNPEHPLRRRRQTYFPNDHPSTIYHWKTNCYWEYKPQKHQDTLYHPIRASQWTPHNHCTPCNAIEHPNGTLTVARPTRQTKKYYTKHRHHQDFTDYIQDLPLWEKHLLQSITFHCGPYEIMEKIHKLPTDIQLYLVSDGSHKEQRTSFGWVFGTADGEIYADHAGPGYGTPTSHRAEAWGHLSGSIFLLHLQKYTGQQILHGTQSTHPKVITSTDNAGLIRRLQKRKTYKVIYPNATLDPDWDLVEQIHDTYSKMPHMTHEYMWTKGHQLYQVQ